MKVLLIGSFPPPLGGVSVFLQRYKSKLEREGHGVDVLDPTKLPNIRIVVELLKARAGRYDLISLNYPSVPLFTALRPLGLAGKTEFWDHNWRVLETWSNRERQLFESFLKACREVILVSSDLQDEYRSHKVHLPSTTRIRNAFIPPDEAEEAQIIDSYPQEVRNFIDQRRPLIVANAFKLVLRQGIDLYGLDMCLDLIADLKKDFPNSGLLFVLGEKGDNEYFDRIGERISGSDLESNFRFLTGQKQFWPLLKRANLMVRPTLTDGYALSVAEANYFKCPIVASDSAARPESTILFRNRDSQDLIEKCRDVLAQQNQ